MDAHCSEYTKTHWTHFKGVNYMACELNHNKAVGGGEQRSLSIIVEDRV